MDYIEIENKILETLSPFDEISSNQLFRKIEIKISKKRFTEIKKNMISQGWIRLVQKEGKDFLKKSIFESPKFETDDWISVTQINCNTYLEFLKENKPLFKRTKNGKYHIGKKQKEVFDWFFHELDTQMIVNIRLVNAESFGLIRSDRSKFHQKTCVEFVKKNIARLLDDHKEFKNQIIEYVQSEVRQIQFKI